MDVQLRAQHGLLATWIALSCVLASVVSGCTTEAEPEREIVQRTLGLEVYIVLCEHLAGTEFPSDVRGFTANTVCHLNEPGPPEGKRLEALRKNRARLVSALDAVLEDSSVRGELESFVSELLPLFDLPAQPMPLATRAMGSLLDDFAKDPEALAALERISGRQGYRPLEHALGTLSAVFKYPGLKDLLRELSEAVADGGVAHDSWQQLSRSVGMELATYQTLPAAEIGALDVARALLLKEHEGFRSAASSWMVTRDRRGFAQANAMSSMGFVDMDGDGFSDVNEKGAFVSSSGAPLALPTPFRALAELESQASVSRNMETGQALDPNGLPVFRYFDADRTLLSGLSSEIKAWSAPDAQGSSAIFGFMAGLPEIMGDAKTLEAPFGSGKLSYAGHDTESAPLLGVMDFASLFIEAPELDATLGVFDRLVTEHEDVAARFAKALLDAKARADQDTQAHIEHPSNFWDEVVTLLKRLSQRRLLPAAPGEAVDETALESLFRALADPAIRHMGGQIAMMGRYNTVCRGPAAKDISFCIDINQQNINNPVQGKYTTRIDRSMPDLPSKIAAGQTGNTSQLQNFLLLVGELMDRPLCNKKTSGKDLLEAMQCKGSPLEGVPLAGLFGNALIGDLEECGFIKVPDMGRAFGGAMMNGTPDEERYGLDLLAYINNDRIGGLLNLVGANNLRTTFDDIFKKCSGVPDFDTRPTGPALARVLFAPKGSVTQIFGDKMFPPATLKPYLAQSTLRTFDLNNPPSDLKLADVFQGSLPAWEVPWQFGDAKSSALMNSIVPLMRALNQHDFFPYKNEAKRSAGAPYFDSDQYLFNPLVGAFALHYPSKASGRQSADSLKPNFSHMSNLASYEGILVDMLGEPDLKPSDYISQEQVDWWNAQPNIGLFLALHDFLSTLDAMELEGGRDGIDVFAELAERMLNPHLYCAPDAVSYVSLESAPGARDGKSACHCDRNGDGKPDEGAPAGCDKLTLRKPLTMRGSAGQDYVVWELGEKYDGVTDLIPTDKRAAGPYQPLAPIDLLLKALNDFDAKYDANEPVKAKWRSARSRMIDVLFQTDGQVFSNPHTVPLLRTSIAWGREHVKGYRDQSKGQDAVRAWSATLPSRFGSFVQTPVMASTLALLADIQKSPKLTAEMNAFMAHIFDASADPKSDSFRAMILVLVDALQLMRDGENMSPIMRAASRTFAPDVAAVLAGKPAQQTVPTALDRVMTFMHKAALQDDSGTLAKLLGRSVSLDPKHAAGQVVPLETLIDVLGEVNRATPAQGGPLDRNDVKIMLGQVSEFLSSKTDGMERMYQIIQNRFLHPEQHQAPQN